jgi:hypothetical protein
MARELLYSTTLKVRGPWLLDAKQLAKMLSSKAASDVDVLVS